MGNHQCPKPDAANPPDQGRTTQRVQKAILQENSSNPLNFYAICVPPFRQAEEALRIYLSHFESLDMGNDTVLFRIAGGQGK